MKSKNKFKYIFISLISISALYNGIISAGLGLQGLPKELEKLRTYADAFYNLKGPRDVLCAQYEFVRSLLWTLTLNGVVGDALGESMLKQLKKASYFACEKGAILPPKLALDAIAEVIKLSETLPNNK